MSSIPRYYSTNKILIKPATGNDRFDARSKTKR